MRRKETMVLGKSRKTSKGLVITIYAGDKTTMVGEREQFQLAHVLQEFGTQHMQQLIFLSVVAST